MWRSESKTVEVEDTEEKNEEELNIRLEEKKKIKRENFSSSPPTVSLRALPIYRYRRFFGKWFLCVCVCVT